MISVSYLSVIALLAFTRLSSFAFGYRRASHCLSCLFCLWEAEAVEPDEDSLLERFALDYFRFLTRPRHDPNYNRERLSAKRSLYGWATSWVHQYSRRLWYHLEFSSSHIPFPEV